MWFPKTRSALAVLVNAAALLAGFSVTPAHALPSYARQTGMDCAGCHIGSFGPQLTPAGVRFKLGGYTDTEGQPGKLALSGMVVASMTHSSANEPKSTQRQMDEASVFLAGQLTEHMGAFVQATYSGPDRTTSLDQADVRYARTLTLGDKETLVGVSVNNNPGVQDPFSTMSVWRFPFTGPQDSGASTLINGGLEGRVLGASAYTVWDKSIYAELGSYRSLSPTLQSKLGLGRDPQHLGDNAYWRLAWMQDQKSQAFHVGLFGWNAKLNPDTTAGSAQDKYRDLGVDGSYQFLGTRQHIATVNASYTGEHKTDSAGVNSRLHEMHLNTSYHYNQTWGGTVGLFSSHGDASNSTQGHTLQVDWTPWGKESASAPKGWDWANLRLGAQYVVYRKFDGATGADARHNNTLNLFAWTSF